MALGMRSLGQKGLSEIANRVEAGERKIKGSWKPWLINVGRSLLFST